MSGKTIPRFIQGLCENKIISSRVCLYKTQIIANITLRDGRFYARIFVLEFFIQVDFYISHSPYITLRYPEGSYFRGKWPLEHAYTNFRVYTFFIWDA